VGVPPRPRVVATGPWEIAGWADELRAARCAVVSGPSIDESPDATLGTDGVAALCRDADAILASTRDWITDHVLQAAPDLRIVAKATIGVEKIDIEAATRRTVLVVNSPAPENFTGLAEATIGLIVALAKRLLEKEARLRAGEWRDARTDGTVLAGRTVGIVGLGRVGSGVARRLSGWDVRLLATDPYIDHTRFDAFGTEPVDLAALLERADVVTLHVPHTPETDRMIGAAQLARMRAGSMLINTSRGRVIDEGAVVAALERGGLGGAALDVFADEPLPTTSPLRQVERGRLILTPHSIGSSRASRTTGTAMAVGAILAALSGSVPDNVLNPEVVPAWSRRWAGREIARPR
jgi:D-3-phosphoglycerate dehydrogenase / 2-oxoglutarate reductase